MWEYAVLLAMCVDAVFTLILLRTTGLTLRKAWAEVCRLFREIAGG